MFNLLAFIGGIQVVTTNLISSACIAAWSSSTNIGPGPAAQQSIFFIIILLIKRKELQEEQNPSAYLLRPELVGVAQINGDHCPDERGTSMDQDDARSPVACSP